MPDSLVFMWPLITSNYNLDRPETWVCVSHFITIYHLQSWDPATTQITSRVNHTQTLFIGEHRSCKKKKVSCQIKYENAVFLFCCCDTQQNTKPLSCFFLSALLYLADPDIVFIMPPPAPTSKGPRTRDLFGGLDLQINSVKNVIRLLILFSSKHLSQ